MQAATEADNGAPDEPLWVKGRMNDRRNSRTEVSLGDYMILKLNAPLPDLLKDEKASNRLGLFVNDLYFKDLAPLAVPGREKAAMFHLVRTDGNREQWGVLFSRKQFLRGNPNVGCD